MSTCSKCGTEMSGNAKYCKSCGGEASAFNDKKARVLTQEKTWAKPAIIAAVVVLAVVGLWMFKSSRAGSMGRPMFPPHRNGSSRVTNATTVTARNGEVRIPAAAADDGSAHFFSYAASGKTVQFFIMKGADGVIRTAFDACVACNHAKLGYRQEGKFVVCNNCGMAFAPTDIGKETGGCNPIPIERTGDGKMIVLKAKDLEAGVQYF